MNLKKFRLTQIIEKDKVFEKKLTYKDFAIKQINKNRIIILVSYKSNKTNLSQIFINCKNNTINKFFN